MKGKLKYKKTYMKGKPDKIIIITQYLDFYMFM